MHTFAYRPRGCRARPRAGLRAIVLAGGLALTACATPAPAADARQTLLQLQEVIGDAACDDDAQCRTVAIGRKACGGPQAFLAWSSRRSSAAAIEQAAARHTAAEQAAQPGDRMSTCSVVVDPGAASVAREAGRRCQLSSAAGPRPER